MFCETKNVRRESETIVRRFTDELTGDNELERQVQSARTEIDDEVKKVEIKRTKLLVEGAESLFNETVE